jgi:lysophospholipase L1-like esterase
LHDLRRDGEGTEVPLGVYADNLRRIVDRLTGRDATLIWARTTPIHDVRHAATHEGWGRHQADVDAYNATADSVMAAAGIAIADLHAAVIERGVDYCIGDDGVHMTDRGYILLGKYVANLIRRQLIGSDLKSQNKQPRGSDLKS